MPGKALFAAGRNISMKVPAHLFAATVEFYRDLVGLEQIKRYEPAVVFVFGDKQLWIDAVATLSQAEIWLEIVAEDLAEAEKRFATAGVVRCDEVEELPAGFEGFWISSPAGVVHLVSKAKG